MSRFIAFLCVIALVSPLLIMEAWANGHRRQYRADRDYAEETRTRLRRQRKLAFLYASLSIPCIVAPLALVKSVDVQLLGVAAAFGVAIEIFCIVSRCPICYKVPADRDGWDLNPVACEGCGAPLAGG